MAIEGVIASHVTTVHEDDRRTLYSVFNGKDRGDFIAAHLKWFEFKRDSEVGNHYHEYAELFCVLSGKAVYELISVEDPSRRETHTMKRGDILIVPARVVHRGFVKKGSIVISANQEPYVSPQVNDRRMET